MSNIYFCTQDYSIEIKVNKKCIKLCIGKILVSVDCSWFTKKIGGIYNHPRKRYLSQFKENNKQLMVSFTTFFYFQ